MAIYLNCMMTHGLTNFKGGIKFVIRHKEILPKFSRIKKIWLTYVKNKSYHFTQELLVPVLKGNASHTWEILIQLFCRCYFVKQISFLPSTGEFERFDVRYLCLGIYECNSISKLQIQVVTCVLDLSAGNSHRYITTLSSFIVTFNNQYANDCTDITAVTRWRRPWIHVPR
jgi:hypothetical protein